MSCRAAQATGRGPRRPRGLELRAAPRDRAAEPGRRVEALPQLRRVSGGAEHLPCHVSGIRQIEMLSNATLDNAVGPSTSRSSKRASVPFDKMEGAERAHSFLRRTLLRRGRPRRLRGLRSHWPSAEVPPAAGAAARARAAAGRAARAAGRPGGLRVPAGGSRRRGVRRRVVGSPVRQ